MQKFFGFAHNLQALEFAIKNEVDVISMSFCLYPSGQGGRQRLLKAIEEAHDHDIVVICSTADEGNRMGEVYPAQCKDTIAIACCDNGGKPAQESSDIDPQFYVYGKGFSAKAIRYLQTESSISGSSVATATAAGLASIILSCRHIATGRRTQRVTTVKETLERMVHPKAEKFVQPQMLFPSKNLDEQSGKEWIEQNFGEGKGRH
jgi:hypothetical protein